RLQDLPLNVGDWKGRPLQLDPDAMAKTEAAGYVARVYHHNAKGDAHLLLLCGRPGPISLHTPDPCFPRSGLSTDRAPERIAVDPKKAAEAQFLAARFRGQGAGRKLVRVFWSFTDGSGWQVPDNPRVTFGRASVLYKLYLMRDLEKADEKVKDDPARDL